MVLGAIEGQRKENLPLRRRSRKGGVPEQESASSSSVNSSLMGHGTNPGSHSARLTLLCAQNALHLGAKTRLSLCPPGRNRRSLQAALRHRAKSGSGRMSPLPVSADSYYRLDFMLGPEAVQASSQQEDNYLQSTNTFDLESDEDASSGDEDDADGAKVKEALFVTAGSETETGKLPFYFRKIRFFDAVTATERKLARTYLRKELRKCKRRDGLLMVRHLRRMQKREKRRLENNSSLSDEEDDIRDEIAMEKIQQPMTPSLSAAMLLESLSMNPVESVEGMAKCYDGIVAAGVAILDMTAEQTRSKVLAALAPLLISSLEQASGQVIVQLAALRRLCGTPRYQRRFVQRVAPSLIRPPRGAMWCLRHQHDMEPILAAAELIFDSANEIFSPGWFDRGQKLLADSARRKTLNNAADQLRTMSKETTGFGLSHGHRRKLMKSVGTKDSAGSHALAEWEVLAVDMQIRVSISNILSKDWSKVSVPARDSELAARNRRTHSNSSRRTTSTDVKSLSSPRSPTRPKSAKAVLSPQAKLPSSSSHNVPPPPDESTYVPTFSSIDQDVHLSPLPRRFDGQTSPHDPPGITKTPPRSPASPPNTPLGLSREGMKSPTPTHPDLILQPPPMAAAPVSPSSVGHSVASDVPYHRSSSNASVASTGSTGSQPAHYRMLTSTAAERKRTVAACRALRSQIQRFEEAFMQLHGRAPKGAAERAPLATTYAQYREWKRAIRADAACRIQALFRGASTRWRLLRSNNSRLARVIMTRAGRAPSTKVAVRPINDHLSLPIDIVAEPDRSSGVSSMPGAGRSDVGIELFISPKTPPTAGHHQLWSTSVQPRRGDREMFPHSPPSAAYPSPPGSEGSGSEFVGMSLNDLQAHKRDLKQQLKQYDMNFARKHGRMPVKAEKEPIRHLYETYNTLKSRITELERGDSKPMAVAPTQQPPAPAAHLNNRTPIVQRAPSPPLIHSISGSSGADSSGSEHDNQAAPTARPKRNAVTKKHAPSFPQESTPSTPPGAPTSQDLAALKTEKAKLHQMLRSYEKDFFKEHKRQVSSFADIKPVASQYRRYKEIKKSIAAFQEK